MDISAPPPRDISQESKDTLAAQVQAAPDLFNAKATYDPLYTDLQVGNVKRALLGNGEQSGVLDLLEQISPRLQASSDAATRAQRQRDVQDVADLAPTAMEAIRNSNPQLSALRTRLVGEANAGLDAGSGLSPEETRQAQQRVRAAQASRGMGFGPSDAFTEMATLGDAGNQRKLQRQGFAQQVAGFEAINSVDPFMAILSRPSQAQAAGQSLLGMGGQTVGSAGAQKFDPFSAYGSDLFNTNFNSKAAAEIASGNATAGIIGAGLSAL